MSEHERLYIVVKVRSLLAQSMFELHRLKEHSTPSGWKQAAEIIVAIGKLRDCLYRVET